MSEETPLVEGENERREQIQPTHGVHKWTPVREVCVRSENPQYGVTRSDIVLNKVCKRGQ